MIQDELLDVAAPLLEGKKVEEVVVGLKYTAVFLEGGIVGLSFTLKGPFFGRERGDIYVRDAKKLAELLLSTSPIESSIGLAVVNAASQTLAPQLDYSYSRLVDVLRIGRGDVLMVGLMVPLAWELHEHVDRIWAVEDSFYIREGPENLEVRPWWAIDIILRTKEISAVVISGSAVSNKTINRILELVQDKSRRKCEIALVGPSVPIFPDFWRKVGVDLLAAAIVKDADAVGRIVKGGGGSRELFRKGCLKKILIDLRSYSRHGTA